jgi:hypothetical protein
VVGPVNVCANENVTRKYSSILTVWAMATTSCPASRSPIRASIAGTSSIAYRVTAGVCLANGVGDSSLWTNGLRSKS